MQPGCCATLSWDALQACKALGLQLDDLVAVCDVMAGSNVSAACHALWSVASACVALGLKVP